MKQNKEYKALKKWLQMYRHHVNSRGKLNEAAREGKIRHVVFDSDGFQIEVKTGMVKSYCEAMDQQARETIAEIKRLRKWANVRKGVRVWKR